MDMTTDSAAMAAAPASAATIGAQLEKLITGAGVKLPTSVQTGAAMAALIVDRLLSLPSVQQAADIPALEEGVGEILDGALKQESGTLKILAALKHAAA
ncbi:hypothetical protein E3E12_06095 [Formicincola oecophyllae]|uniref:Uncharacterized protein n=1 Tax=Formicincola oecophyllae TaxID=2558361 RepID=A0A4Y6UBH6_9PROT|nr:hypothetical protein [Formicincola oecophyllae]QDH13826.1 hypothetical protein E3E12_06095 [Formicincola oecophyllae]